MRRAFLTGTAVLCVATLTATPASAQKTRDAMAAECAGAVPGLAPLCAEGVLALEAARGGIGLAATQGTPVPGSASTLGRRLGASPRIALSLRTSLTRVGMPDPRAGSAPADGRAFWVPAVEGSVALGVLDGISPLPTVGGIFSTDLIGSVGIARVTAGNGFDRSAQWFGYGARIGLLRESFTLPGVTVSAMRRRMIGAEWGGDGQAQLEFKPTVTSIRAAVGKDFLAFGIIGGWGWERYGGTAEVAVQPIGASGAGRAASSEFASDRTLIFGGLSYTFLVLQFAAEGGFATGWDEVPGRDASGYDPTGGSIFGSVSGRLTF